MKKWLKLPLIATSMVLATVITSSVNCVSPVIANAATIDYEFTTPGYVYAKNVNIRARASTSSSVKIYGTISGSANNPYVVTIIDNTVENGFYLIKNPFGSGYAYISTKYVSQGSID